MSKKADQIIELTWEAVSPSVARAQRRAQRLGSDGGKGSPPDYILALKRCISKNMAV